MGYIKGEDRQQTSLFPESMEDYITAHNPVRIIDEYVEQLDMKQLGFQRAEYPNMGRPPYAPKDMLKLYLYGYLNRIRSSRRLEQETIRNLEVIWLVKKLRPDFKTIADFRKDNKKAVKAAFRNFVRLCDEWNLFGKELVAIDGTKIRACTSKRNNFSTKKLERHIQYIDDKIDTYLQELEDNDTREEADRKPSAEEIQKRIEELRNRKQKYEAYQTELAKTGKKEISTTDADARLMGNNNNNVDVSYNVQVSADAKHKLIADFKITNQPNDLGELDNMALRAKVIFQAKELEVLADKGYYKAEDLKKCVKNQITPYVTKQVHSNGTGDRDFYTDRCTYDKERNGYLCPAGQELHFARKRLTKEKKLVGYDYRNYEACSLCQYKARCTNSQKGRLIFRHADQDFLDTIDQQTKLHKDKYKLRQMIIEHIFGTVKRGWEAYYFLTKRKLSVSCEMALSFLAYNLRRAITILGPEEILRRLREKREPAMA